MALPNLGSFPSFTAVATASGTRSSSDDPNRKVRKHYTISKSRESWTEPENDKFMEAIQLFDRDWKKIEAFIGSKSVIQIRSHAQKYFLKVQKSGIKEHLPPPRPKRKAAHPYPQKASKVEHMTSLQASPVTLDTGSVSRPDTSALLKHSGAAASVPFWINNPVRKVLPDFAQVYSFIGSVFHPNVTDHLQKLKKMDRIDIETVLLLMRNLSINLSSPEFEDHRRLLSTYVIDQKESAYDAVNHIRPGQFEDSA